MSNFEETFIDYKKAVSNLKKVMQDYAATDKENLFFIYVKNAAVKMFELAYDLAWKSLKHELEKNGVSVNSPRSAFVEGVRTGIIKEDEKWFDLIKMRNNAAHAYDTNLVEELLTTIPQHVYLFEELEITLDK